MKNKAKILVFAFICMLSSQTSFSQGYNITSLSDSSYYICGNQLTVPISPQFTNLNVIGNNMHAISIQGTNFTTGPISATINWGDGQTQTFFGQTTAQGVPIIWNSGGSASHTYAANGTFQVIVNVSNAGSSATVSFPVQITQCNSSGNIVGFLDCDNDGTTDSTIMSNIPLNITASNGQVYTYTQVSGQINLFNLPLGPFSIQVDSLWLATNGYAVTGIVPSSNFVNTNSSTFTIGIQLTCTNQTTLGNCGSGFVFCDSNGNGLLDQNEAGIAGVNLFIFGMSTNMTTDSLGFYSFSVPNGIDTIYVGLDTASLNPGMFASYVWSPLTFLTSCDSTTGQLINFPVNCFGVNANINGCGSGVIYCDSGFNSINGAPITVTNLTTGQVLNTSSSFGTFFYQGLWGQATDSVQITVDASWLGQNGYYLPINSQTLLFSDCNSWGDTVLFITNCDSVILVDECIKGYVFCDDNNNGIKDSGEVALSNAPIQLTGQNFSTTVYSDASGFYLFNGANYFGSSATVAIDLNWMIQNGYTSLTNSFVVSTDCDSSGLTNFAINCGSTPCADLRTSVTPWFGYFQNQNNYIKLFWGNNGPNASSGYTLSLTFPSAVIPDVTSFQYSNYVISGNTITWTFANGSSSFNQMDVIKFFVPAGFPSGTQHTYSSTITAIGNVQDCNSFNNDGGTCLTLGNSYDPNDKSVNQPTLLNPSAQDELTYVVRFQNTGTAPAQDVFIIDTLSTNLDWSTLRVISFSHNMQLIDLGNGVMKFYFPGIWLPDSTSNEPLSHGNVIFKIKEKLTVGLDSPIENTAYIYFDWNPAIITNTTYNVNSVLGLNDLVKNEIRVYPNPFLNTITVVSSKNIDQIVVTDIAGKVVFEDSTSTGKENSLDLEFLESGVYLIQTYAGAEVFTTRIIKK